jgi:hypothetical protein
LPLIGNDFPLRTYLGHGPLVAWTALSSAALPEIGDAATIAVATLGSKGRPLPHVVSVFVLEEHDARS